MGEKTVHVANYSLKETLGENVLGKRGHKNTGRRWKVLYENEFPHEEIPEGILKLSEPKFVRVRNLMFKYVEIGYTGFDLVELGSMSIKQWSRRDYTVPEGYKLNRKRILIKIPPEELLVNSILKEKSTRKSNSFVK